MFHDMYRLCHRYFLLEWTAVERTLFDLYSVSLFLSICLCSEVMRLMENKCRIERCVFEGDGGAERLWSGEEEGGCKDVGESGVFGDDPGGEEVFGGGGRVGVDDVVVVSPSSAIGAGGAEGASGHFDGADNFRCVIRVFESYVYSFPVSLIDNIAASVDEKSSNSILSEEIGDAVAEVTLADRAEVEKNGIFDSNMRAINECYGFQKIGRKPDYFLWREGIVGIVAKIGEGVSDEWRDFPIGCLVELEIQTKHSGEIAWHGDVAGLSLGGYARDERCWDESREYGFKLL